MALDPATVAQLQADFAKQLAAMASGAGGTPDVITPALGMVISQGWLAEIPDD